MIMLNYVQTDSFLIHLPFLDDTVFFPMTKICPFGSSDSSDSTKPPDTDSIHHHLIAEEFLGAGTYGSGFKSVLRYNSHIKRDSLVAKVALNGREEFLRREAMFYHHLSRLQGSWSVSSRFGLHLKICLFIGYRKGTQANTRPSSGSRQSSHFNFWRPYSRLLWEFCEFVS